MATKRRPLHPNAQSKLNFRPSVAENTKSDSRGTRPLPEPSSVSKVILMMILHVCRKIMFMDTRLKVGIYLSSLFVVSLLSDVLPFPKTYFAWKDNIFNMYFVKIAWGWTLILSVPFVVLTSSTYCCGKREKVLNHLIRLAIATATWFFWVRLFAYIESSVGRCNAKGEKFQTKSICLEKGLFWQGFDLSGHAFILMYSSLVLIEEARAIVGWDGIEDMLRNEEYSRSSNLKETSSNPLKNLDSSELAILKFNYEKYTPYVRGLFICITFFVILWDFMLVSTMLYFHTMVEKFISGCIASVMWFLTYRCWYTIPSYIPQKPGEGVFKYMETRSVKDIQQVPLRKRQKSLDKGQLPRFMGMPLYGLKNDSVQDKLKNDLLGSENGLGIT